MTSLKRTQSGFTIVELLIVIIVIGILAALVLVTFSGVQQKARNTERVTGKHFFIADNSTAEGRQQYRRTEIVLAPKPDKLWKLTEKDQAKELPEVNSNRS